MSNYVVKCKTSFGDPVKVFRRPHSGIGATRNFGVLQARGELLAFLDSDDLWTPDKLEKQVSALERDSGLNGVFGLVKQFYTPGLEVPEEAKKRLEANVETGYHVGAMLIELDSFDSVGPFDEEHRIGEFIDWYARAQDAGLNLGMLDQVIMRRRIHRTNTGIVEAAAKGDYAKTMKIILDRRRKAGSETGQTRRERVSG